MGFLKWFAFGLVVGLLTAPRTGRETLETLRQTFKGYASDVVEVAKQRGQEMTEKVAGNGSLDLDDDMVKQAPRSDPSI